ncbi:cyclohexanone monooxygenase [Ophiobolus disseminans]|uniref:Cyclohexanone monooxygenase n=1 Tax=Ophiobolus disseminans TaxID=1469910 RepID=A0A6A7A2G7_9PLEO|nr:cyclohexanone monooxygenase [Ophiobolus disseminans]
MVAQQLDALVVGAGYGGIYALKKLSDQGLHVKVIDAAGGVGGTWYWNRYPGAMSDTESYIYRYSWDVEDLQNYPWKRHYLQSADILAYLNHVVDRHNLRQHVQLETEMKSARWSESETQWIVETANGDTFHTRYFIPALGLLSKKNYPDIPGLGSFNGVLCHTAAWPESLDLSGKRVGVIGNGSTGVQVITAIAKDVKQLLCFQRNPQYSVPSGDRPVEPDYRKQVNERYDKIWDQVKNSIFAFGFEESTTPAFSVSEDERQRVFEEYWRKGNGFRFMFGTFSDITVDEQANVAASDFIRSKIRTIVKDQEKARKLLPHERYARRPLCDAGYYDQFNRANVDIISLRETPISEITATGIKTSDGTVHELDVIVFATGFDAVDGSYTRVAIKGRNGESLKDRWDAGGPTSYLGVSVPNFPNMLMITGPMGPFTNLPPTIETQVEFIADTIAAAKRLRGAPEGENSHGLHKTDSVTGNTERAAPLIEATEKAEEEWTKLCDEISTESLFRKADSWIFGKNVPGKKVVIMFYFGGLGNYRKYLKEIVKDGHRGFRPLIDG